MKLKRLLLIPDMKWLGRLLFSLLLFFRTWWRSRRFGRLAIASPAIALIFAFVSAVAVSHLRSRDPALLEQYLMLARQAVADGNVQDVRLLFQKASQLAQSNHDIITELASSLYELGEQAEAYQLLESIAPTHSSGHLPAHRFLAQHPPDLPPEKKDYFQAVHLSHLVRNSVESREERVELLHLLAKYRKLADVEALVDEALDRYPEDRLLLAQLKSRQGDQSGARWETEAACRVFETLLAESPHNVDLRIHLAQAYVFLGRFPDAVCVLSEGMPTAESPPADSPIASGLAPDGKRDPASQVAYAETLAGRRRNIALTLSNTYLAWMTTLPTDEQQTQLQCLDRLLHRNENAVSGNDRPDRLATAMRAVLLNPSTSWVLAALDGNARVARGEWDRAEDAYRLALKSAPDDPTLANNLAWVLLRKCQSLQMSTPVDKRQQFLAEALALSEQATADMPNIVSFLETRGQIHAELGNHSEAMGDLTACVSRGKDNPTIQRTIEACVRALR